jgi:hypothetical protein
MKNLSKKTEVQMNLITKRDTQKFKMKMMKQKISMIMLIDLPKTVIGSRKNKITIKITKMSNKTGTRRMKIMNKII